MERGVRIPQGRHVFQRTLGSLLAQDDLDVSPRIRALLADMAEEIDALNRRIQALDDEITDLARSDPAMKRLMEIPGVGPMIASALVAAVGRGDAFRKGRDLSAWLGLVPKQTSTGGKTRLAGISKRGNSYLRKLFIHGARAALHLIKDRTTPLSRWVDQLARRSHGNVATVALANKLARIAWAVLTSERHFDQAVLLGA
jgi:transposase